MIKLYYFVMGVMATTLISLGWDSTDAVSLFQLALIFGGVLLGHIATELLNTKESDE